ncbi:MAG: transcriptional regulator [Jatrophihabitantaceae bacterium]
MAAASALVLLLPTLVGLLPAGHSSIGAGALLRRIQGSGQVGYSGYAESVGALALPVTSQFNSVDDLFGGSSDLRVWWRGPADWRVDTVTLTGETDTVRDPQGVWTWNYEAGSATRDLLASGPDVRLPRSADLVPAVLARRLLAQAAPADVTRLPDARVAGQAAAGLRLRSTDARSTIGHVDVWALPASGLALQVSVYARGGTSPVLTSSMLDLSIVTPPAARTAFRPPSGARLNLQYGSDVVSALDHFTATAPPRELAGLAREQTAGLGAVGVYGRGLTQLAAVPLPPHLAGEVAAQLGSVTSGAIRLVVGPLNLLLTAAAQDGSRWLLAGTVTAATLAVAGRHLPAVQDFQ